MRIAPLGLLAVLAGCSTASSTASSATLEASGGARSPAAVAKPGPGQVLLTGRVLDRDGAPAPGATVSVVPHTGAWDLRSDSLAASVRADPDGRFQAGPLAPGAYGIAASLVDGAVVFGAPVQVQEGQPVPPVELRAGDTPVTLAGTVVDEAGRALSGAALRVVRPLGLFDEVAALPFLQEGRFEARLPAGEYNVVASAPGFTTRMLRMTPGTAEVRLERPPTEDSRRAAVAWARETAISLQSVEAGHGFDDLRGLTPVLKDVRVVGLGEASHGTREFFQLKHRMLEFLASELGFTVLAIEAGFTEARALNDYVLTGRGDPGQGLKGLIVYPWQTEELLELVRWMRRYNEDPANPRKLKFYGVDMQSPLQAATHVREYLRTVDSAYAKQVEAPLSLVAGNTVWPLPGEHLEPVRDTLEQVARRFDARRAAYTRQSGKEAWAVARQALTVLSQSVARLLHPHDARIRDRAMADNVRWVLEHEGPGTKAVFWAHNMHIARGPGEWTDSPAGRLLGEALGRGYYAFGFAFHQGAFQALHLPGPQSPRGVAEFTVPPAPEDSLDAALASTGLPRFALDLRPVPPSGPVREWWRKAHRTRDPGAFYSAKGYTMSTNHSLELYDGLLFVERSTRARPLPWIIQAPESAKRAP